MSIIYDNNTKSFHLIAKNTSYILQIHEDGYLSHLYFGRKLRNFNCNNLLALKERCSFSPNPNPCNYMLSLDTLPQEYPSYGTSDFRTPAYSIQLENGTTITDLRYESHKIINGKPKLENLPATYVEDDDEAQTLEIVMFDSLIGLKVILSYTAFENYDAITRNVKFINSGNEDLKLLRALSMSIDFNNSDYDFLTSSWCLGKRKTY